jgi:hypothetical protein
MTDPIDNVDIPHRERERHDRLLREWQHDTYKSKLKLDEPAVCPGCGAFFHNGHWQWGEAPPHAHESTCPACHRIADHVPAGFVSVSGAFFVAHRGEIERLIHNVEQKQKAEHPLKRVIKTEALPDGEEGILVTLTDPHLAHDIGEALESAYKGRADFDYQKEEYIARVSWRRDAL